MKLTFWEISIFRDKMTKSDLQKDATRLVNHFADVALLSEVAFIIQAKS